MRHCDLQQVDLRGLYAGSPIAEALLPNISSIATAEARSTAQMDSLEIMAALETYRREQRAYPASINDLSPSYLAQQLIDPFTGQPYRYLPALGGYQLYSPGLDQIDNGGVNSDWRAEGEDLVFVR